MAADISCRNGRRCSGEWSPEVQRASRLRKAAPGEQWSQKERNDHERDTIQLLRRGSTCMGEPVAKKARADTDSEHIASWDFLASLHHVLEIMTDCGLDSWYYEGAISIDTLPPCLFLCMDFCQIQWRVLWFPRHQLQLNIEGIVEPVHRRNNDLNLAIIEAEYGTDREKIFLCANVHYAPYEKAVFHKDMQECAAGLSVNADPDDPELIFYWERIVAELGIPSEDDNRTGREKFLKSMPNLKCVSTKGEKAAKSKWGSMNAAWDKSMDGFISVDLYIGTHLAKKKKWINTIEDLHPQSSHCDKLIVWGGAARKSSGAANSGATVKAPAGAKAKPAAKAVAVGKPTLAKVKKEVQAEKSKCKNGLHFVIKTKFDQHWVNCARQLVAATAAECMSDSHFRATVLTPEEAGFGDNLVRNVRFYFLQPVGPECFPLRSTTQKKCVPCG